MNIAHQNSDDLNAVITVELSPEDYNPQVDKAIKEQAKKANLPGFRPGKVPTSHIRRTFGKSILFDEINQLVSDQINKYVEEQQLTILGQPLPAENDRTDYSWDFKDKFVFNYDIGLAPKFETPFTGKSTFTQYVIKADKKTMEERMRSLRRSYGKMTNPDVSEDGDVLYASLVQLDEAGNPLEEGISKEASVRLDLVQDKAVRKSLVGLKIEDEFSADFKKAFNPEDAARILSITPEGVEAMEHTNFRMKVLSINRLEEADLDETFYTRVFGEGVVNSEEEFEVKVREEVESMLVQHATQKLQNDFYLTGLEKVKAELPKEFLKRWLQSTNPELSETELEEGFEDFLKNLRWTLIENQIIRENDLEVKYEEVLDLAKERISAQLKMYGQEQMPDPSEEQLQQYAMQLLQDREQANRMFDEVKSLKVFDFLQSLVKIQEKEIEYDKFLKLD